MWYNIPITNTSVSHTQVRSSSTPKKSPQVQFSPGDLSNAWRPIFTEGIRKYWRYNYIPDKGNEFPYSCARAYIFNAGETCCMQRTVSLDICRHRCSLRYRQAIYAGDGDKQKLHWLRVCYSMVHVITYMTLYVPWQLLHAYRCIYTASIFYFVPVLWQKSAAQTVYIHMTRI